LNEGSITAVFSLDGLYLAQDISLVVRELRRIMALGAPLLFTCYLERHESLGWIAYLQNQGFVILGVQDITADWRNYMGIKHSARWEKREAIRKALGDFADQELSVTKCMLGLGNARTYIEDTYRYLIHAVRQ
jgi:hypothetical protein